MKARMEEKCLYSQDLTESQSEYISSSLNIIRLISMQICCSSSNQRRQRSGRKSPKEGIIDGSGVEIAESERTVGNVGNTGVPGASAIGIGEFARYVS